MDLERIVIAHVGVGEVRLAGAALENERWRVKREDAAERVEEGRQVLPPLVDALVPIAPVGQLR